jgi:hypothetical protein
MEETFEQVTERHRGKAKMDRPNGKHSSRLRSAFTGDNIEPRTGTDNSVLRNIGGLEG